MVLDGRTLQPVAPGGSLGFRFGGQGLGHWNLDLGDIEPMLTLHGAGSETVEVDLPRFDMAGGQGGLIRRGGPARRVAGQLVTTVFNLLLAQYDAEAAPSLFGAIDALRIPIGYLAGLFTAGDTQRVRDVLARLAAMRSFMRDISLGREPDTAIPAAVA